MKVYLLSDGHSVQHLYFSLESAEKKKAELEKEFLIESGYPTTREDKAVKFIQRFTSWTIQEMEIET